MATSRPFSARLSSSVADRLDRRRERTGESKSRLAERYIDEGMRLDDHPGIIFRDGPTGRRAALPAGPDVWQVIWILNEVGEGESAIAATSRWMRLADGQVRAAIRYRTAFPEEIEEWIRSHAEDPDAAEEAWRREQATMR
jgi:hypothetical protein